VPELLEVNLRIVDGEMLPSIPTLSEPRFSQSLARTSGTARVSLCLRRGSVLE
jgi:hypothetical protein